MYNKEKIEQYKDIKAMLIVVISSMITDYREKAKITPNTRDNIQNNMIKANVCEDLLSILYKITTKIDNYINDDIKKRSGK